MRRKSSQVKSSRVDPGWGVGWSGYPGSTRVARVILGPLGHPEPVGSSHAKPGFFSVHLINPAHPGQPRQPPGQPGKTRSDPVRAKYERLGSARLSDRLLIIKRALCGCLVYKQHLATKPHNPRRYKAPLSRGLCRYAPLRFEDESVRRPRAVTSRGTPPPSGLPLVRRKRACTHARPRL